MKAVMLSIRPQWCAKIANGEKTIEVRKSRPKLETPFKCYIYCTLQGSREAFAAWGKDVAKWNRENWGERKGMVIGEFICDSLIEMHYNDNGYGIDGENGIIARSCATERYLYHYLQGKNPFIWHISDLVIYYKPRELSEFRKCCKYRLDESECTCRTDNIGCEKARADLNPDLSINMWICEDFMKRPFQSWGYVEELK